MSHIGRIERVNLPTSTPATSTICIQFKLNQQPVVFQIACVFHVVLNSMCAEFREVAHVTSCGTRSLLGWVDLDSLTAEHFLAGSLPGGFETQFGTVLHSEAGIVWELAQLGTEPNSKPGSAIFGIAIIREGKPPKPPPTFVGRH